MQIPDYAHQLTDKELAALERRIASVYREARNELDETIKAYFENFAKRDEEMKALVGTEINGKIWTEQDYKLWRFNQIGRGKRFHAMRAKVAERVTNANVVARTYVQEAVPGVYALNRNYTAYTVERQAGNCDFTLWDEATVKRMIVDEPELMPYYSPAKALNRGIDLAYGQKQIAKNVTSGILLGKSIKQMADDLQSRVITMNRNSAIRAARTAVTGAQNAGRMDTYHAAEQKGIKLQKKWLATLDARTRHEHRLLDGQKAAVNEPFTVDGYEIRFPGDPTAEAYLTYNCRCTMVSVVDGVDAGKGQRRARDPETGKNVLIENMTYQEWEAWKKAENATAWETFQKKGKNLSADTRQWNEYRAVLGNKAPNTVEKFQNLKYNEPEKWAQLKTIKRQNIVVRNAECVTTPKKYTGYFLKEGAKHADQFFDVGYTSDNPLQLRYDMARQFDISKAVDIMENDDGSTKFNIYMTLGVDKKRTFCTGWRIDKQGDNPRIITAFRSERGKTDVE